PYTTLFRSPEETVVSQIARRLHGTGLFYYAIQAATALILVLAANTPFADFPRLSSLLARDHFVPRQFANLGERLVFSNGILVLAGFAALLVVVFGGETHALIPLYAVGVFISFTLSQSGMVRHWWLLRGAGWRYRLLINGVGRRRDAGLAEGDRAWRVLRDGAGADGAGRGEVDPVGARGAAGGADLAVSLAAEPAARLHRPDPGPRRRSDGDDRAAGVPAAQVVAAHPAQPDRAAREGRAAVPPQHRRGRRAVLAEAL